MAVSPMLYSFGKMFYQILICHSHMVQDFPHLNLEFIVKVKSRKRLLSCGMLASYCEMAC